MRYGIIVAVVLLAGCGTARSVDPSPKDLCLRSHINYAKAGYTLTPGRYSFSGSTSESTRYEIVPGMESGGQLIRVSDKEFIRNIEAFWITGTNADLCVNVMRGRECVNVEGLRACGLGERDGLTAGTGKATTD